MRGQQPVDRAREAVRRGRRSDAQAGATPWDVVKAGGWVARHGSRRGDTMGCRRGWWLAAAAALVG